MTEAERIRLLSLSRLFSEREIELIAFTVGTYTLGNAIVACELLGLELDGSDIDILIGCLND